MKIRILLFVLLLSVSFNACDLLNPANDEKDSLEVRFINDSRSEYTITTIQLKAMGKADATDATPCGEWSEDILTAGQRIALGDTVYFSVDIPNLHWSQYRLGVTGDNGSEIMLHEQPNFSDYGRYPITHWGSDQRTVGCTVVYDASADLIHVSGWSDWADNF